MESKPQPRNPIISGLARRFVQDTRAAIHNAPPVLALEIVNHLLGVLESLEKYYASEDGTIYDAFWAGEEKLTAKWGRLIKPYREQNFDTYFSAFLVLTEKGLISDEEHNAMTSGEEQCPSAEEIKGVTKIASHTLGQIRYGLQLEQAPSNEAMELLAGDPASAKYAQSLAGAGESDEGHRSDTKRGKDKEQDDADFGKAFGNTKTRSRLALYYLIKAGGVEPRADSAVSALAKFAHFLTGEKLTTLNNSNTYKFYLSMPEYKTAKGRLEDLAYIRPFFEELGMIKALDLIDADTIRTNAELPQKARK